jgi:hypothetical protein
MLVAAFQGRCKDKMRYRSQSVQSQSRAPWGIATCGVVNHGPYHLGKDEHAHLIIHHLLFLPSSFAVKLVVWTSAAVRDVMCYFWSEPLCNSPCSLIASDDKYKDLGLRC